MNRLSTVLAGVLALGLPTLAHAAVVGTLTCNTSKDQVKVNLSYFTFGVVNNSPLGGGSAGSPGKVQELNLNIHTALVSFQPLFSAAVDNLHIEQCLLTTTGADGNGEEFLFKDVAVKSVTAVASASAGGNVPSVHFTDAQFEYGSVLVKTSSGVDNGGTGAPAGWNITTNTGN